METRAIQLEVTVEFAPHEIESKVTQIRQNYSYIPLPDIITNSNINLRPTTIKKHIRILGKLCFRVHFEMFLPLNFSFCTYEHPALSFISGV